MAEQKERIFKYNDQVWADPGPEFTVEDVRKQLSTFFPELARAGIQKKDLPDGTQEVEFVKRSGIKGLELSQFPIGVECPYCGELFPVEDLPDHSVVISCPHCTESVHVIRHESVWFTLDECDEQPDTLLERAK